MNNINNNNNNTNNNNNHCLVNFIQVTRKESFSKQVRSILEPFLKSFWGHLISVAWLWDECLPVTVNAEAIADLSIKEEVVDYCTVKAPFNGTVVKIHVKQYQTISKNIEILELLDNTNLRIELIAPSNWLSWRKNIDIFWWW